MLRITILLWCWFLGTPPYHDCTIDGGVEYESPLAEHWLLHYVQYTRIIIIPVSLAHARFILYGFTAE